MFIIKGTLSELLGRINVYQATTNNSNKGDIQRIMFCSNVPLLNYLHDCHTAGYARSRHRAYYSL